MEKARQSEGGESVGRFVDEAFEPSLSLSPGLLSRAEG